MRRFLKTRHFKESLLFIALAYGFSGLITLVLILCDIEDGLLYKIMVGFATTSPSISAIFIIIIKQGFRDGLNCIKKMLNFKLHFKMYAFILLLPFAFMLMGKLLSWMLFGLLPLAWVLIPDTIATSIISPLGEEFGWRGFLTGRLTKYFSIMKVSIILGLIWAGWHYWFFLIPGEFNIEIPLLLFVLSCVADTILYTYFFLKSEASVVTAILFHFAYNLSYRMIPIRTNIYLGNSLPYLVTLVIELLLGIFLISRGMKSLPNENIDHFTKEKHDLPI